MPGRVRIEIYGLKHNLALAQQIIEWLGRSEGIEMVSPCIDTGRLLIMFSEQKISVEDIINRLRLIEVSALDNSLYDQSQITEQVYNEVAVTTVEGENLARSTINYNPHVFTIPNLRTVGPNQIIQSENKKNSDTTSFNYFCWRIMCSRCKTVIVGEIGISQKLYSF